ncbi:S1 RNA-binding domain-containing protein 1-like [Stegastes partitus]|nr:PREDICTED: S1 RNA-binding domain-containing protein 1-like [Stegastes partitus]
MLMRHVAGLNAGRARSIAEWREQKGPFINREQLKLVKGMGPKSYQQCAGFIRINPQTLQSVKSSLEPAAAAAPEKSAAKKGKGKTGVSVPTSFNPLDQTCIHPESYHVAHRFLSFVGGHVDQIGSAGLRNCVESKVKTSCVEELARTLDTTPETLKLIMDGLTQPPGFDIRQNFGQADFKRGIVSMSDLQVGAVLTGRVENTALFGAFVDIGVGRSGLIHKSNITLDKLPVSQRRRSLALGPGERVEVRVLSVDSQRGRIGLDLIRVLQ